MGITDIRTTWPAWTGRAAAVWSAAYAAGAVGAALSPGRAYGYALGAKAHGTAVEWAVAGLYTAAAALGLLMLRRPGLRWAPATAWVAVAAAFVSGFGFLFSPAHLLDLVSRNQDPMDWAAWANQGVATLGAVLWTGTALAYRRRARGTCPHCGGRGHRARAERRTRAGYVAVAALLPYALLKSAWAAGARVGYSGSGRHPGLDEHYAGDQVIRLYEHGVDLTVVLALTGMALALVLSLPRFRRLPRLPLLALGWAGAGAFAPFGAFLLVYGSLAWAGVLDAGTGGHAPWVVAVAYGGFCFYGVALGRAVLGFQRATRRTCRVC
ncbi:hypothetical protein [Streptomyces luteireticuli]|uniref:Integral membrane protein n=1 Tax=Streptomyces luteireticuli TaxID=173858 RepID=A0ABN0YVJ3_9ACTN